MRKLVFAFLTSGFLLAGCSGTQLDPAVIANLIKTACGIAVPVADIVVIINADTGHTAKAIVDVVCSGYKSAIADTSGLKAPRKTGEPITFVVQVNGKDVTVHATPQ